MHTRLSKRLAWVYALLLLTTSLYGLHSSGAQHVPVDPIQASIEKARALVQGHENASKPDALQEFLDQKAAREDIQALNRDGRFQIFTWGPDEPAPLALKEQSTQLGANAVTVMATAGTRWHWTLAATGIPPSLSSQVQGRVEALIAAHPLWLAFIGVQLLALIGLGTLGTADQASDSKAQRPSPAEGKAGAAQGVSAAHLQPQLEALQLENTALRTAVRVYADQLQETTASVQQRRLGQQHSTGGSARS
ncbi:hypothetical protein WG899_10900 [Paucibacter sp. AS339]|uniref:hypothetical protein n=1 Tax=Paucibacter hankyongi TaxID=3133434 RepID=UPI00309F6824